MGRKSGKDGFRCTNSTVICNLHFKSEDIIRVAGGGRNRLVSGAVPVRWNETISSRNPKRKKPTPRKIVATTKQVDSVKVGTSSAQSLKELATEATKTCFATLKINFVMVREENKTLKENMVKEWNFISITSEKRRPLFSMVIRFQ